MSKHWVLKSRIAGLILLALAEVAQSQQGQLMPEPGATPAGSQLKPAVKSGTTVLQLPASTPEFFTSEARVRSKVDKLVISVGELINYQMEVEIPKGYSVAIPPPGAQLGQFLIRHYEFPEPEKKADRMVQRFNFQITAYTTGELSIPPVPVFIQKDNQTVKMILAEEIKINVAPVTSPEDLEIKDIKPPLALPFNYKPFLIVGSILIGFLGMVVGGIYGWRRWREPRMKLPEPLPEPEELALKELAELSALGLLEKGELDRYYTKLSEILRRYLGLRFQIYALEFTTSEILSALHSKGLEHYVYQLIREFLEECDLVKFARFIPELKAQQEVMGKARRIIELTKPEEGLELKQAVQGA